MDSGAGSDGPLSPKGIDFSNETQAAEFLEELLNDDQLKIIGNAYARYFWYCIAVVVGLALLFNIIRQATLQRRYILLKA